MSATDLVHGDDDRHVTRSLIVSTFTMVSSIMPFSVLSFYCELAV